MKIVYVVDSISNLVSNVNLLTNKLGNNILFVVRADLENLFRTYGFTPNAIYYHNLTKVIHNLLVKGEIDDIVICYASLKINENLLNKFINKIGNREKIVNLAPKYNTFEKICNATYNVYVKSLFKTKDSLVSAKMQFIPSYLAIELLSTHLGNRLFDIDPKLQSTIQVEDKEVNKSMKTKINPLRFILLSTIISLITIFGLLLTIAFFKASYLLILLFVVLLLTNITISIIFLCKAKFDARFLK